MRIRCMPLMFPVRSCRKAARLIVTFVSLALVSQASLPLLSAPAPGKVAPHGPPHPRKVLTIPGTGCRVAYSPDGKRLLTVPNHVEKGIASPDAGTGKRVVPVTAQEGREAILCEARGGKVLTRIAVRDWIPCIAFSPDGRTVAVGRGGLGVGNVTTNAILLADGTTGKRLALLKGHTGRVLTLAFSPDGRWLASGAGDETVRV